MSGLCIKEKKAIIEYGFGNESSKIYLARKTPVEVKTGVGMPPAWYPPKSNMVNKAVFFNYIDPNLAYSLSHPFYFSFTTAYSSAGGDSGMQCWIVMPGNGNDPPYISQGASIPFKTSTYEWYGNRTPIIIDSVPVYGRGELGDALCYIEIWLDGQPVYKDFGRGQAWYKVKCGNGCVEDEEITVTEVASYPGHWCLSEEEMNKLRQADRILQSAGKNLDKHLRELNAENDRLRRELSKPLPPIRPDPPT